MFPKLQAAIDKLNAKRLELKAIFDEAGPERDMDKVTSIEGDSTRKVEVIQNLNAELEDLAKEVADLKEVAKAADAAYAQVEDLDPAEGDPGAQGRKTFGKAFVESAAFLESQGTNGPLVTLDLDVRNTLFERTAGFPPESTRTGYIDLSPERRPSVIDFIPQNPTGQSSVLFMRETTFDDSLVVEKAEGAAYGEAQLALTEVSLPVQKVPAFIPVTDEQFEDVEGAEAYVNGRLVFMVRRRVDRQLLQGTGVAPLLEGTENVTGIQTQAKGADTIPDALFKLFTLIRDDNDAGGGDADPSVAFMRATKWQDVALERTADGIYIWGSPAAAAPTTLWGVPIHLTNAVSATKVITGDYAMHSYVAVKRGVEVQVSNSHDDYFVKGKKAIRADVRLAMVHLRPSAFGEVTGL